MNFTKYHGLGNDFLVVDLRGGGDEAERIQTPDVVRATCERRFGVGADGILAILPPTSGDARMRVLNADGSEAEMCGNGLRCVVKHLIETDPALDKDELVIDTGAGALTCHATRDGAAVTAVRVNMGPPRVTRSEVPMAGPADERAIRAAVEGVAETFTAVSMGNPHAIHFTNKSGEALRALAESVGPVVETHASFPARTNVEFARVASPTDIELVVWERGCGITLACGTGACATAVAACLEGHATAGTPIKVRLLGGDLEIEVVPDHSAVFMTGPATRVYSGEL